MNGEGIEYYIINKFTKNSCIEFIDTHFKVTKFIYFLMKITIFW